MKKYIKKNKLPVLMWLIFEIVAISLFISTHKVFYLLNFTYIGTCISSGIYMMVHKKKYARIIVILRFYHIYRSKILFFYDKILNQMNLKRIENKDIKTLTRNRII